MKVFISWSTEKSHRIALALKKLLKNLIPKAEPWVSSEDIQPGERWNHVLSAELEESSFGIVCLVPENLSSPWVLFEAGAIAKSVADGRLIPLIYDILPADIPSPLRQFQAVQCDESGIGRLVRILNERTSEPKAEDTLEEEFRTTWPQFLERVTGEQKNSSEFIESQGQTADISIRMGFLGSWRDEQIIIENNGDGVAEEIEVFADMAPVLEAPFVVRNQELVSRLRPGEECGVKIALSMGSPKRTDIKVQWREESGEVRSVERLLTLL